MGSNYQTFLAVLKKWPIDTSKKSRDFGNHLRELFKKIDHMGNVFPRSQEENAAMYASLLRLTENKYKNQYIGLNKYSASGFTFNELKSSLSDEFIDNYNKKKVKV